MIKSSHIAFSDESQHTNGRFGAIAMVSMLSEDVNQLSIELINALEESDVKEATWKKVKTAQYRFAAIKVLDIAIRSSLEGKIRIDTIIWDRQDDRHQIQGRDEIANFQRMYYHLFFNVLSKRWGTENTWILYPDEQSALNWEELDYYLEYKRWTDPQMAWDLPELLALREKFKVLRIHEIPSIDNPLIQVADIFAGMGTYSYECYPTYRAWEAAETGQLSFLNQQPQKFTAKEQEHSRTLHHLLMKGKYHKLGISMTKKKGLYTPDPKNPINYWPYTPQHHEDKAPIKDQY